ncbi:MAG: tRNA (N6-threonylcarbamoyladenosine(37)-N6)-methyltransferase TrmO [Nanobdellota archaeon]
MNIEYRAIGKIFTGYKEKAGMPIQSNKSSRQGIIKLKEEFKKGLKDLDEFSHIMLFYHFHESSGYNLVTKPFLDNKEHGIFAIRAPKRPNSLGFSIVKLIKIKGREIYFEGADMLDQTPLIDIKPYSKKFDHVKDSQEGWLEKSKEEYLSDNRFSN